MENLGTRHTSQRRLAYSRSGNRFVSNSISFILSAGPVQRTQDNAPRLAATWIPQANLAHRLRRRHHPEPRLSRRDHAPRPRNSAAPSHLSLESLSATKWLARPLCRRQHRPALALNAKTAPGSGDVPQWHAAAVGSARQNATTSCRRRRPTRCFGA